MFRFFDVEANIGEHYAISEDQIREFVMDAKMAASSFQQRKHAFPGLQERAQTFPRGLSKSIGKGPDSVLPTDSPRFHFETKNTISGRYNYKIDFSVCAFYVASQS